MNRTRLTQVPLSFRQRAAVFAKAADSNLIGYNAVYGLGCRAPKWGGYDWLEPTMRCYHEIELLPGDGPAVQVPSAGQRKPWNSFTRASAAGAFGIIAPHLVERSSKFTSDLGWKPDPDCRARQSLLDFEINLIRPRYVFVNVGTNGAIYGRSPGRTARQVSRVVRAIKWRGPVPIVFTLPPSLNHAELTGRWDFARETSERIREAALKAGTLLIEQWQMLTDQRVVNHGLIEFDGPYVDGFHLDTFGGFRGPDSLERAVDFRPEALVYGAKLRSFILLRTLRTLDAVLED
jgi:lysophospholipase L1-like esterase